MTLSSKSLIFMVGILLLSSIGTFAKKTKLPEHPSKITYKSLNWRIPLGKPYRTDLKNGLRLYIAEDHALPLVTISSYFETGSINDPKGKEGLGAFTATLMRTGGTETIPSDTLDALLDHFAITISLAMSETMAQVKAQFLSEFTDTALYILEQILFHPAFEQEKMDKERTIIIQNIKHRFDNPEPLIAAAYKKVMYPNAANSLLSTEASMNTVTRDDLIAFHKETFHTKNCIFGISGDFKRADMEKKLEKLFPQCSTKNKTALFPSIATEPAKKYTIVNKDISQVYVRLGLPLFKRPHPDYYSLSVLNLVLGGASFSSRLVSSVRSDAGLTYSIYSQAETNYVFPGTFYIDFFTKPATANQAIALTLKEVNKIVSKGITDEELSNAKKILIDQLPSMFRDKDDIVDTYTWNEYYGRPDDHYRVYPGIIEALTREDILQAARKHIKPDNFIYVIVGDTAQLYKANKDEGFSLPKGNKVSVITPDMLSNPKLFQKLP